MYISFGSYHVISLLYTECVFSVSSVLLAPVSHILISSCWLLLFLWNFNFEFTTFYVVDFLFFVFFFIFCWLCSSPTYQSYATATMRVVDLNAIKTWIPFRFFFFCFFFLLYLRKTAATIFFHMICSSSQSHYFLEREMIICIKRMKFEHEHLFRVIAKCDTLESYCNFVVLVFGPFSSFSFSFSHFHRMRSSRQIFLLSHKKILLQNKLIKMFP